MQTIYHKRFLNKEVLFSLIFVFLYLLANSQDFSNKGKDFWLAYPGHIDATTSRMALYISSDQSTTGIVELAGTTISFSVTANQATVVQIYPATYNVYNSQSDGINPGKGIHITAGKPIVVYAHVLNAARSGSTLVLPTNTLGREYTCIAYTQIANTAKTAKSQFTVVGVEDNTTVEITPSVASVNNTRPAGVAFTIVLNKGDVYQFQSYTDITGSKVKSLSTGTGCKPLAVFSGSTWDYFDCIAGTSGDNLFDQLFPSATWGKNYVTAPFATRQSDIFRIMVQDPGTIVTLNGTPLSTATLVNGTYYEFKSSAGNVITSDKPILVIQFMTSMACTPNANVGDPEMIILNAVEQTLKSATVLSARKDLTPPNTNITAHYLNIITLSSAAASIRVDGTAPTSTPQQIPGSKYSFFQENVTNSTNVNPTHTITGDSGFIAVAYGLGNVESYGYNAGTSVKDLYQFVSLKNEYATVDFPATCKNTPFFYSITLPYNATSLTWDFSNNPNLSPNNTVVNNAPVADSTFTRDGRTLYVYRLKAVYSFSAIGTYPVKVTANNPTPDGCSGFQEIDYDVVVYDPPTGDFSIFNNGCVTDSLRFKDATNGNTRPVVKWKWNFGDQTMDSVKNPFKKYTTAGTYNVKLQSITDIGCIADTTKTITITPQPAAFFKAAGLTCVNNTITFTDSSTVSQGNIVKWYWNFGNGQTIISTTNAAQNTTYTTAGKYVATLQAETNTGCKSNVFTKEITVYPNPAVKFSLPVVCLPGGVAKFNNSSTAGDGSALTYLWQFGDNSTGTLQSPSHSYTTSGPFAVKLTVTTANGCVHDTTEQLTTIYPPVKSAVSVSAEVCLRDTTFFADKSDGNGSKIVAWRWNFGDNKTDTVQNPAHLYRSSATYKANLVTITDKGCASDTLFINTIVNPLPVADFLISSPQCVASDITFTDKSVANTGNINNWFYNFGDNTTATYTNGNAFTKKYSAAGTYTIKAAVTTDKGCRSDTTAKVIVISALPVANFTMPQVCLSDVFAQFKDSSYITGGSIIGSTYLWNFGDANATASNPNTSTLQNPAHKYLAAGFYNVSLTVTASNGCPATIVKQFVVNGSVPKADFTVVSSSALCSNTAVQIQNTSSVDFGSVTRVQIVWDGVNAPATIVTDSFPSFNKIYSHTYPSLQTTQTYQVRFKAYSGISCVNESVKTITVNASPKVIFTTIPGICFDANSRLITQASGGVAGTGTFSGKGITAAGLFTPSVTGQGTYFIHYLYTSSQGCKDSADQTITVWPSPTANWSYSSPTCVNNAITFTDNSTANFSKINQWSWNFGDGSAAAYNTPAAFSKIFTSTGSYDIKLVVKTDSGCQSAPVVQTVSVHPLPKVDFSLPNVCLPVPATFTNLSTISDGTQSRFSYLWSFSDPNNTSHSSQKDGVHAFSTTGPFSIKLVVTSGDGCVDSASKLLATVYPQPKANFTVSPADSCLGGTFVFADKSNGLTGSILTWNWKFGDGTVSGSQNPTRKYTSAQTFNVSLVITNQQGCFSDTAIKNVVVHSYPIVNAGPDQYVLEGGSTVLNATAYGNNLQYRWTPATWLDNPTILKPVSTPADDISYRLTVTGTGGCTNYDDVFIKLLKAPTIPNAFSPNGDGINDVWLIKYLESYPGCTVQVFNRYGSIVFESNGYARPWDGTMNGSPLPVGVYYYIINPKNGRKPYTGNVTILR